MKPEKVKLFIVDDDPMFLITLEHEFHLHSDFTIEAFATAEQCIERLGHKPDVIILDYHLNSVDKNAMNGLEALEEIKKVNPGIPVVLLSASEETLKNAVDVMKDDIFEAAVKSKTAFVSLQRIITSIFNHKKIGKQVALVYGDGPIPFQLSITSL
ncbi:MAG: response regulator [Bacteroidota bacterium]|nr:response regulator [Bacteroidota bacterium]